MCKDLIINIFFAGIFREEEKLKYKNELLTLVLLYHRLSPSILGFADTIFVAKHSKYRFLFICEVGYTFGAHILFGLIVFLNSTKSCYYFILFRFIDKVV